MCGPEPSTPRVGPRGPGPLVLVPAPSSTLCTPLPQPVTSSRVQRSFPTAHGELNARNQAQIDLSAVLCWMDGWMDAWTEDLLSCTLPLCGNFLASVQDVVQQGRHVFARQPSCLVFAVRGGVGLSVKCQLSGWWPRCSPAPEGKVPS